MFEEEDKPAPKNQPQPRVLERLSIAELDAYVVWLEEEIGRVRADKKRKQAASDAASKLFMS